VKAVAEGIKTPAFARVPSGMIRAGVIQGIPRLLAAKGIAVAPVVEAVGLPAATFADADVALPVGVVGELLACCAEATNDPHFGLHAGQLAGLPSFGVDGFVVQNSPDVATALRNLERHLAFHDRAGIVSVTVQHDAAALVYELTRTDVPGRVHILGGAMAIACNLMRALCGEAWTPQEAWFAFRKPVDVGPYRRFFRAPVRFDADACMLLFPAATLAQPVVGANPVLYRILEGELCGAEDKATTPFAERLACLVRRTLGSGGASLERVAALLAMHPRTLNRRLQEQGTTFHEVVDEVRSAMSRAMLADSDASLTDIAASLGYADASAFARAFRRWTGVAPSAWRRRPAAAAA